MIENARVGEGDQLKQIAALMTEQLVKRYQGNPISRRGVRAKGHGRVTGTFQVSSDVKPEYRCGVFAQPGKTFSATVRFSNAATFITDDSPKGQGGAREHGSRGMAIKLLNVGGTMLEPDPSGWTQDFLMINQPVFAFANVEDCLALSKVLADSIVRGLPADDGRPFFLLAAATNLNKEQIERVKKTAGIIGKIHALTTTAPPSAPGTPTAFQTRPASPVETDYFGASSFKLGKNAILSFLTCNTAKRRKPQVLMPSWRLRRCFCLMANASCITLAGLMTRKCGLPPVMTLATPLTHYWLANPCLSKRRELSDALQNGPKSEPKRKPRSRNGTRSR
jgi:hypothetical protein